MMTSDRQQQQQQQQLTSSKGKMPHNDRNKIDEATFIDLLNRQVPSERQKSENFYQFPRLFVPIDSDKTSEPFILQPSLFGHVPPTIFFEAKLTDNCRPPIALPKKLKSHFRWKISSITPNSIRNCISFMGFDTIKATNITDDIWLGAWCRHMLTSDFAKLYSWQKVNHYPGSFHLGRKDKLWHKINAMQLKHGKDKIGEFHPRTFVLPRDYSSLEDYWLKSPSRLFIMKPPASARGNGITVINSVDQIPASALEPPLIDGQPSKKSTLIVQQYISNPCLLANGQKFDLRIYVLLTSVDPLRIYVFEDGLVRFASVQYSHQEDGLIDQYMHLTNYSVNKNSESYQMNNDSNSLDGCKWTLKTFWRYLREKHPHIKVDQLWNSVIDIVIKTIISCEGPMYRLSTQHCKNEYAAYELFGFDIILDQNFKPWILEVNITPSLKSESALDTSVKSCVIRDMFNIVGYNLPPQANHLRFDSNATGSVATGLLNANTSSYLSFDERIYQTNLTKDDKIKHIRYLRKARQQYATDTTTTTTSSSAFLTNDSTSVNKSSSTGVGGDIIRGVSGCKLPAQLSTTTTATATTGQSALVQQVSTTNSNMVTLSSYNNDNDNDNRHYHQSILEELTSNDVRMIMLSEDELSRCGQFIRVFPSQTSHKYSNLFEKQRYSNLLLDAWERKYHLNRCEVGIKKQS